MTYFVNYLYYIDIIPSYLQTEVYKGALFVEFKFISDIYLHAE